MKKTLQNFGSVLSILFLTSCNLAGFRNCLAEYIVHSLSSCYGLLTAFVLLTSAARWCNTTQLFTKMVSFYMLVCMGVGRNFSRGGTSGFLLKFFYGGPKVVKFGFTTRNREQHFCWNFQIPAPLPTPICLCVGRDPTWGSAAQGRVEKCPPSQWRNQRF